MNGQPKSASSVTGTTQWIGSSSVSKLTGGRRHLGQPDHEIDVGEGVVGRPAAHAAATVFARVHQPAERESVVTLIGGPDARRIPRPPVARPELRERGARGEHQNHGHRHTPGGQPFHPAIVSQGAGRRCWKTWPRRLPAHRAPAGGFVFDCARISLKTRTRTRPVGRGRHPPGRREAEAAQSACDGLVAGGGERLREAGESPPSSSTHSGSGGEGMSHYERVRSVREKSSPLQSSGSPSWRASA